MATTLTISSEEFENDEFEDAEDHPTEITFDASITDAKLAVNHFFNNNFLEARSTLEPHHKTSLYHALGVSVFDFLEAILTFEPNLVKKASQSLGHCIDVCNRFRRKTTITHTIGKMVGRSNYDNYTPEEVHAELCYAEALLLKSMLSFIEDETLVSFIKAGIKIRSCYNSYKECNMILKTRNWGNETHKIHFEGGVKMGIGTFNLMISLLPTRVIKLLEFIGFSGSKEVGLAELEAGWKLNKSMRQVLCVLNLLAYHLIVTAFITHKDGDLKFCETILKQQLKMYPKGVWFLFFQGRLELMKGNLENAQYWYKKSWKSQDIWPQFHHLCFWELMWNNCMMQNWREACMYADYLMTDSKWSRAIYSYQKASILLMLENNVSRDEKTEVENLMRDLPNYKQRIAGKSIPMEKFVIRRADRYFLQKKWLCLPAIEMMYIWNMFKVFSKKMDIIQSFYKIIESEFTKLKTQTPEFIDDNTCLLLLLKGSCLRHMQSPLQAEGCLKEVIKYGNEKKIKEDTFLVPYAIVELGLLNIEQFQLDKAAAYLEDAKKNYTGYSLESRLHFKIHSALNEIYEKNLQTSTDL